MTSRARANLKPGLWGRKNSTLDLKGRGIRNRFCFQVGGSGEGKGRRNREVKSYTTLRTTNLNGGLVSKGVPDRQRWIKKGSGPTKKVFLRGTRKIVIGSYSEHHEPVGITNIWKGDTVFLGARKVARKWHQQG